MSNRDLSKSTAAGFGSLASSTVVPKNKSRRRDNRLSQSLGSFVRTELHGESQPWNSKISVGIDVEKRAEYLLRDVRQLALPRPGQWTSKKETNMYGSMQAYASGANALASMTSAASYELDVLMSSNGTKDLSKPSGGINIAEKDYRDAEEVKNDGIVSDGKASTSEQHREKYLATYTGLDAYSSEGTTKLEMLIRKARNALENATPGADGVRHGGGRRVGGGGVGAAVSAAAAAVGAAGHEDGMRSRVGHLLLGGSQQAGA